MTVANNPNLKANRHPWNRNPSVARETVEGFLAAAEVQLNQGNAPFHWLWGSVVLAWLRTRLDSRPGE